MKQVIQNYKTGELKVDNVPGPLLGQGEILVESRVSLISAGTEKSTLEMSKKSLAGKARARPDLVKKVIDQVQKDGLLDTAKMIMARLDTRAALGYSSAGVVAKTGERVEGFSPGDRVACAGQNYASHAEVVSVPQNLCVKIPDEVDFEDASYVAVGSIALQGVRQADPKLGETVAVIGLGLLGQLVIQMLKANGCQVIATDLDIDKLKLATDLGADRAVTQDEFLAAVYSATSGHGADSVIVTASTTSNAPIQTAGEVCRKKGCVVVVGAVGLDIPREPYYSKELDVRMSCSYGPGRYDTEYEELGIDYPYGYVRWTEKRNMSAFLNLIATQKVNVKKLTTHRFVIDEAGSAYEMISKRTEPYIGILLLYPDQSKDRFAQRIDFRSRASSAGVVKIGLIGAGNHTKDKLLPAIRKNKFASVRAVCTGTGISAKVTADKEYADYCVTNYEEIILDEKIDAVVIGTRHDNHAEIVIAALQKGKHVFVEKPLCLSLKELAKIDEVFLEAAKQGLTLQVGFNRRHSEHARRIRDFFSSRNNPLTMIYRVNAGSISPDHWSQDRAIGGGRIIGEACHFVDFMQYIVGADPVSVFSFDVGSHDSGITNDKSVTNIKFADGSVGALVYCGDGDKSLAKERFEAFSDGKSVVLDDFKKTDFYGKGRKVTFKTRRIDKGFSQEIDHFISGITGEFSYSLYQQAYKATLATLLAESSMSSKQCYELE